jgi:protein SCO1/2
MRRLVAALLTAPALLGMLVAGCGADTEELSGFVRNPAPDVSGAQIPDASRGGETFDMKANQGGVLVVYFGYTSCPDVCPTTLADLRGAMAILGDDAEKVSFAMVTIDPERDTGEILTQYVQSFIDGAHSLRSDDDAMLRDAADLFGADYGVTATEEGDIEVEHTAHLYAVDDTGLIEVTWPFGMASDTIADDLRILLDT